MDQLTCFESYINHNDNIGIRIAYKYANVILPVLYPTHALDHHCTMFSVDTLLALN